MITVFTAEYCFITDSNSGVPINAVVAPVNVVVHKIFRNKEESIMDQLSDDNSAPMSDLYAVVDKLKRNRAKW